MSAVVWRRIGPGVERLSEFVCALQVSAVVAVESRYVISRSEGDLNKCDNEYIHIEVV